MYMATMFESFTLIPKSFGATNFRTKKFPKFVTPKISIFSPCPKESL